jgi:hypothetical protein
VIGLMVLGALFAYVAVFYQLVKRAPTRTLKIAVVIVGLAIPCWDLPISYLSYRMQCSEHKGMHIFGDSPRADSILIDPGVGYASADLLTKYGFKRVEYATPSQIVTFTKTPQGIEKSSQAKPTSAYRISRTYGQQAGWNATRRDLILSNVESGNVIARHSEIFWHGMWWQITIGTGGREIVGQCNDNKQDELLRFTSGAIR